MTDESPVGVEYGFVHGLSMSAAEKVVRAPARIRESQPSPEHAPVSCRDCGKSGYAAVCYTLKLEEATPKSWKVVPVCRDCADRDDPLCGVDPSELSHPLVRCNSRSLEPGNERFAGGDG